MTATTLTLTDFLLARIAEDEAWVLTHDCGCGDGWLRLPDCPDRVLAECETKRRIVETCRADYEYAQGRNDDTTELAEEVLWHLAAAHADHPDYREEWRA